MDRATVNRRDWLKLAGAAAVGAGVGAASSSLWRSRPPRLAKVRVSRERVIRTAVGLRPFRASGFRLQAESLEKKTVIHNYGHGGGGVTLSWGSAHLALEEALKTGQRAFAVMGCGAVGLATARLLQRQGFEVTIYAKDLPPKTTSNVACASWYPAESSDPNLRTAEYVERFTRAARLSYRYFQEMVGEHYGIRWLPNYTLFDEPLEEREDSTIADLFPETRDLARGEHPFGYPYCQRVWQMLIEPPVYLNAVMRDFLLAGGKVVVREFTGREDLLKLPEPVILNCTGIGAKALFQDEELMPIKGQLTILLPQPEVDYMFVYQGLYMMPRADGVLLGGTHERGEWSLEPNPVEGDRVMSGHIDFFRKMA
jgi:D-amino-acid oxidase